MVYVSIHHLPTNWSKIDVSISFQRCAVCHTASATAPALAPLNLSLLWSIEFSLLRFEMWHVLWLFSHFKHEISMASSSCAWDTLSLQTHCFEFAWLHSYVCQAQAFDFNHRIIIKLICIAMRSMQCHPNIWPSCYFSPNLLCFILFACNVFLIGNKMLMVIFMQSAK